MSAADLRSELLITGAFARVSLSYLMLTRPFLWEFIRILRPQKSEEFG